MKIWECKIGEVANIQNGADGPMRDAVYAAYCELTGQAPDFIFSGWGAELTEGERAVVENRLPDPALARTPPALDGLAGDIATVAEMITGSHERDYVWSRDDVSALRRILTALGGTGEQSDCAECGGDGVAERIGGYERSCDACHGKGALPLPPQHRSDR
jgi:hypothetical protein